MGEKKTTNEVGRTLVHYCIIRMNKKYKTRVNEDLTYLRRSNIRALCVQHLHHEFGPPAVILVVHLLQTLDHLPEGGDHMDAKSWLQERTRHLEVLHRGVEHLEVFPVR